MRAVEDGHARPAAGKHVRGSRAGRPRADDRYISRHRSGVPGLSNSIPVIHYTAMVEVEAGRFTVGVFQDVAWATKAIAALVGAGLPPASLTILAKDTPDGGRAAREVARRAGRPAGYRRHRSGRSARADGRGPAGEPTRSRQAWAGRRRCAASGFQAHDGRIFEALVARGGILVAVHSEPRAADALAVMFSYGGGNAAIGAWTGRV